MEEIREITPVDYPWGEPKTVQRLRAMVQSLPPEIRECSTTWWAADEIDRLRRLLADLLNDCDNWGCAPSDRYAEALADVQ